MLRFEHGENIAKTRRSHSRRIFGPRNMVQLCTFPGTQVARGTYGTEHVPWFGEVSPRSILPATAMFTRCFLHGSRRARTFAGCASGGSPKHRRWSVLVRSPTRLFVDTAPIQPPPRLIKTTLSPRFPTPFFLPSVLSNSPPDMEGAYVSTFRRRQTSY